MHGLALNINNDLIKLKIFEEETDEKIFENFKLYYNEEKSVVYGNFGDKQIKFKKKSNGHITKIPDYHKIYEQNEKENICIISSYKNENIKESYNLYKLQNERNLGLSIPACVSNFRPAVNNYLKSKFNKNDYIFVQADISKIGSRS